MPTVASSSAAAVAAAVAAAAARAPAVSEPRRVSVRTLVVTSTGE